MRVDQGTARQGNARILYPEVDNTSTMQHPAQTTAGVTNTGTRETHQLALNPTPPIQRYQYITVYVSGNDMAQGLRIATDEFERAMIGAFAGCKDLHIAILAVTLALFGARAAFIVRWVRGGAEAPLALPLQLL